MGRCRILSKSSDKFLDRNQAGELLARELSYLQRKDPVVLGVPRGGVIVAQEIRRSSHFLISFSHK